MFLEIQIMIDDSLGFIIYVFGWFLFEDYELYIINLRLVINIIVFDFVKSIGILFICFEVKLFELLSSILYYVIVKFVDFLFNDDDDGSLFLY